MVPGEAIEVIIVSTVLQSHSPVRSVNGDCPLVGVVQGIVDQVGAEGRIAVHVPVDAVPGDTGKQVSRGGKVSIGPASWQKCKAIEEQIWQLDS